MHLLYVIANGHVRDLQEGLQEFPYFDSFWGQNVAVYGRFRISNFFVHGFHV